MKINLGKYLDRLGLTSTTLGRQPTMLDTIQPVATIADLSHLASPTPIQAYLIGSTIPLDAANASAFTVTSSVPLRIRLFCASLGTAGGIAFQTGLPPAPNLINPVQVFPQSLLNQRLPQPAPQAIFITGAAAVAGATIPSFIAPAVNVAVLNYPFEIPGGSWMSVTTRIINTSFNWMMSVEELPGEID